MGYSTLSRDVGLARMFAGLVGASGQWQDLFPRKQSPHFTVFSTSAETEGDGGVGGEEAGLGRELGAKS